MSNFIQYINNRNRIIGFFLCLSFLTMNFGEPFIGDKLSLSNLIQIITVCFLIFGGYLRGKDINTLIFFLLFCMLSTVNILIFYNYEGRIVVIPFMLISITFVLLAQRFILNNITYDKFANALNYLLVISLFIFLFIGLKEYIGRKKQISFGMDDKSHAAIILCFLSFLCLSVIRKYAYIYSLLFFILTLITISRIPFVFFPFLFLSFFYRLRKDKGINRTLLIGCFVLIPLISVLFSYLIQYNNIFEAFKRIGNGNNSKDSNSSHLFLIKMAFDLKIENWHNLLFGVSPGSFADILVRSDLDFKSLNQIDPTFLEFARLGKAPIHSTHMAFLCEYPIVIFGIYTYIIAIITRQLFKQKLYIELFFWIGFLISIMLYSAHNKPYFYVIVTYLFLKIKYSQNRIYA